MRVSTEVTCRVCRRVFCCAECRYKHEIKAHAIVVQNCVSMATNAADNQRPDGNKSSSFVFCPICECKPLALHQTMSDEILAHIEINHLPLRCKKCAKIYSKLEDLKEFSKCLQRNVPISCAETENSLDNSDQSCGTDASKVTVTKELPKVTISTQTSPFRSRNELDQTPISVINLRWKAKNKLTHEEFISDSVSSIRNISSISNGSLRRSVDAVIKPKGALVRTTSTPVHSELVCAKTTERTFNGSGGQVSSIYNSGGESDQSPALPAAAGGSPSKQQLDNVNRYVKVGARAKITAVTPLRQVMSKSIQKALAEHGGLAPSRKVLNTLASRKGMLDCNPVDLSDSNGSPLDLRLSPVIRRSQSAHTHSSEQEKTDRQPAPQVRREIILSSQKLTTESIVITRTQHLARSVECIAGDNSDGHSSISSSASDNSGASSASSASSMFKTCHSVEIITSTTALSELNIQQNVYGTKENLEERTMKTVLPTKLQHNVDSHLPPITPITRVPGAVISKKLIRFDTPNAEFEVNENENADELKEDCSTAEVFFTPNATPVRKKALEHAEPEEAVTHRETLRGHSPPARRPPIRDCAQSSVFNRVENLEEHHYADDEVFLPRQISPKKQTNCTKALSAVGRSWSFGALLGTVMRLPSLSSDDYKKSDDEAGYSSSLIKRCASIAGSLVRPKPAVIEDQLNNLKRKRVNNNDAKSAQMKQGSSPDPVSPITDHLTTVSSKRFRIQGRKPIERMRRNT